RIDEGIVVQRRLLLIALAGYDLRHQLDVLVPHQPRRDHVAEAQAIVRDRFRPEERLIDKVVIRCRPVVGMEEVLPPEAQVKSPSTARSGLQLAGTRSVSGEG